MTFLLQGSERVRTRARPIAVAARSLLDIRGLWSITQPEATPVATLYTPALARSERLGAGCCSKGDPARLPTPGRSPRTQRGFPSPRRPHAPAPAP